MKTVSWQEFKSGILWVKDFYDWPISGVANFEGKRIFFKCTEEDDNGERIFGIYDIPDWTEMDQKHVDFCKYVGEHWNYVDGKRGTHILRPQSEHHKFYDKYQDHTDVIIKDGWLIAIIDSRLDEDR